MRNHWFVLCVAAALVCPSAQAADEPKLADTTERLTPSEEKSIRTAIDEDGLATATPGLTKNGFPRPRVLVVPKIIELQYARRPKATVRSLLKIVEDGEAWASITATAYIEALVESPEFAAITARGANAKTWDEVIGDTNRDTFREHSRKVLIKMIAEKEAAKGNNLIQVTPRRK
jgi:hypothetical protein